VRIVDIDSATAAELAQLTAPTSRIAAAVEIIGSAGS
jgi:hypothetical protein